jgi:hypothetical protein
MDFSKCPQKVEDGETWYFYQGQWMREITAENFKDISDRLHYDLEKVIHSGEDDHKYASSKEAMVVGCYKFLEIREVPKQVSADVPGRFVARALYNKNPNQDYLDKKGGKVEVFVRLNPLLNRDAQGPWCEGGNRTLRAKPLKSLKNFIDLLLNKEIQITHIGIVPDGYGSKSYIYHWEFLK